MSLKKDLEFLLFVKTNLHIELPLQRMANILVKKNEDQVIVELCKLIEKEAKDAISRNCLLNVTQKRHIRTIGNL